jgi:hypothetical protein
MPQVSAPHDPLLPLVTGLLGLGLLTQTSVVTRVVGVAYLPLFRLYLSHPYLPIG